VVLSYVCGKQQEFCFKSILTGCFYSRVLAAKVLGFEQGLNLTILTSRCVSVSAAKLTLLNEGFNLSTFAGECYDGFSPVFAYFKNRKKGYTQVERNSPYIYLQNL
jgi:hypothetical protein